MKLLCKFLSIGLSIILISCDSSVYTSIRQDKEFAKTWEKNYSIALLTPYTAIYAKSDEDFFYSLQEMSKSYSSYIRNRIYSTLRKQGYKARKYYDKLSNSSRKKSVIEKFHINALRNFMTLMLKQIYVYHYTHLPRSYIVYSIPKTLQDELVNENNITEDIIIYTQYIGYRAPKKPLLKMYDEAIGLSKKLLPNITMDITKEDANYIDKFFIVFIETDTGKILWTNYATGYNLSTFHNSRHIVNKILFTIPNKSVPREVNQMIEESFTESAYSAAITEVFGIYEKGMQE